MFPFRIASTKISGLGLRSGFALRQTYLDEEEDGD